MMTDRMTEKAMFTNNIKTIPKIISVLFVFILLITSFLPVIAKATNRHLVTLLLIPDKSVSYTDYDSAYLTIMNNKTGESSSFVLYPYNNFSNKVWLDDGEYSVLDAGISGRNDIIFEAESEDILVDRNTAIIVNFSDSKIINSNTTQNTKVWTTEKNEKTSATTGSTTTQQEPSTLFSIPDGSTESTVFDTTALTDISQESSSIISTTTAPENTLKEDYDFTFIIIIAAILTVIILVFLIVLYKKNKAEDKT